MLSFGGFLNSNFWSSYRSQSSASIEELLNNKDCSVEKLLEDDDCLQEFKNLNDKLIQYFDHDKMKRLVDFITVMPPEDATHQRGHKFPFIASEIFNCEINSLLDKFFDAPESKKEVTDDEEEEEKHEEEIHSQEITSQYGASTEATEETEHTAPEEPKEEQAKEEEEVTKVEEPKVEEQEAKVEEVKQEEPVEQPAKKEEEEVKTPVVVEEVKQAEEEPVQTDEKVETKEEPLVEKEEQVESKEETQTKQEEEFVKLDEEEKAIASKLIVEPEPEEEDSSEKGGRYQLLDRLFKFIRTEETPLNAVLAGYFTKLVTLLINRKQRNLIPYVFSPESDVLKWLLFHVYQKSISELLNKFLSIQEHDFDSSVQKEIKTQQQSVIQQLIEKLSSNSNEEDNLNASSILQDMLEMKDFFNLLSKRHNVNRIVEIAFSTESNVSSKNAALSVLLQLVQLYNEKKKNKDKKRNDEDEDDTTLQQSDEEEEGESPIIEAISNNLQKAIDTLEVNPQQTPDLETSYDVKIAPLGSLRLKLIELAYLLVKLNKPLILQPLGQSNIFGKVSALVAQYPWNNFLQLKVISLYEEILEHCDNKEFRADVLSGSNIGPTLVQLANKSNFEHQSQRHIRHGYMAAVVKIANFLQKNKDSKEEVGQYVESLGDDWKQFIEGELKRSNDTNSRSLGGQQPRSSMGDDEDNDKDYEMNMDKIMAKFSNFNVLSQKSNDDDDEENQEEEQKHDEELNRVEDDDFKHQILNERDHDYERSQVQVPVVLKEQEPLNKEFVDQAYWKVDILSEKTVDELLAEMEL